MINYHNKKFKPIQSTKNGEVNEDTTFTYLQQHNILTCKYEGGSIISGHLIGIVNKKGSINMRYHHINIQGELMTGICNSTPEIQPNGKIRLYEKWQWTSGDQSKGESILEEL